MWRADGTSFPAEYWSHPIVRGDEVLGAVVTFLDITERRRAEQEIQDGVRRREQFLAMLSHELRNPLAAILSATRAARASTGGTVRCARRRRVIERQARHMARLLDDLLDVARITRGRIVLRQASRSICASTAQAAIEALAPFLAERGTRLTIDMPDDAVPVVGDAARLQQIQANLLSNAAKYSPPGGEVTLRPCASSSARPSSASPIGAAGSSATMLPTIFDLFVQGSQPLDRSDGGLGIGLTLLRSLVELHDGRVEAHSEGPGRGSVFTVWLPLAALADVRAREAGPAPPPAVSSVAVVEDQEDAREMLQHPARSRWRHRASRPATACTGAQLIEQVRPDLALVDLGLPVMNGFDLARRVRRAAGADPAGGAQRIRTGIGRPGGTRAPASTSTSPSPPTPIGSNGSCPRRV